MTRKFDQLVQRKVRCSWPEDNDFYEASHCDYNPLEVFSNFFNVLLLIFVGYFLSPIFVQLRLDVPWQGLKHTESLYFIEDWDFLKYYLIMLSQTLECVIILHRLLASFCIPYSISWCIPLCCNNVIYYRVKTFLDIHTRHKVGRRES